MSKPGPSHCDDGKVEEEEEADHGVVKGVAEGEDVSYETSSWRQVEAYLRGDDCRCRLNCFASTTEEERRECFGRFYSLQSKNEQDAHLQSLMALLPIHRRRPRVVLPDRTSKRREINFSYSIITSAGSVTICKKAFIAIHGISDDRVRRLGKLLQQGKTPRDLRGLNRPGNAKPESVVEAVRSHIASFLAKEKRGNSSQSSDLSEKLNLKAMYCMFKLKHPDIDISKSYYITRFHKDFSHMFSSRSQAEGEGSVEHPETNLRIKSEVTTQDD